MDIRLAHDPKTSVFGNRAGRPYITPVAFEPVRGKRLVALPGFHSSSSPSRFTISVVTTGPWRRCGSNGTPSQYSTLKDFGCKDSRKRLDTTLPAVVPRCFA